MNKTWYVTSGQYYPADTSSQVDKLQSVVYTLQPNEKGILHVTKISDKFEFEFKVYGIEDAFISRVIKTYNNTKGNLGVLLNGVKGTGKTITAEIIANTLELPVIIIKKNEKGLDTFLSQIEQDVVIFIDEYDKNFKEDNDNDNDNDGDEGNLRRNSTLLTLMDGVLTTIHRKVFILTTNKRWINSNMLNRPGRIRYVKNFEDLNLEQINEIMDDCLKFPKYKGDILGFLKPLKLITVDIVKAVVSQVNIFDEEPTECCKDLNVEIKSEEYTAYEVNKSGMETIISEEVSLGSVSRALNAGVNWKGKFIIIDNTYYYIKRKPDYNNGVFEVNSDHTSDEVEMKMKIQKRKPVHRAFGAF